MVVKKQVKPIKKIKNDEDNRIDEYTDKDTVEEIVEQTELPQQRDFFKIPRRFGSVPVDVLPLGCDKEYQYRKIYPRIPLPFQKADRVPFGHPKLEPNRLFWGDNLHVMRMLPSNSIDLIYIDPPFFSGRKYNVIFGDQNEVRSFTDIWEGGLPSYLIWLNARLLEMKRLLKTTGSIFVHLDWHASHYVKSEMDKIFGVDNFRNEIFIPRIRKNVAEYETAKKLNVGLDSILFYSKTEQHRIKIPTKPDFRPERWHGFDASELRKNMDYELFGFKPPSGSHWRWTKERSDKAIKAGILRPNPKTGRPQYKINASNETNLSNLWDDISAYSFKYGYPTEKNEKLLKRILEMSSNDGDVVADFFCGGGTTPNVAQKLNRKWIACDQSRVAVAITQGRLESLYEKSSGIQQTLSEVPDTSVEYWGTYEVPGLEKLTQDEFSDFIVTSFGGRPSSAGNTIHGYKRETPIFVGSSKQSIPVTKEDVITFAEEITKTKGKFQGNMLGWSFAQSARIAVEKLIKEGNPGVDLIQISQVDIESPEFRKHVTKLHNEYESFLKFILPPEVIVNHKRIGPLTYEFDTSESIPINEGSKIVNVQWDFDYLGRFTPTKGFIYGRDAKAKPLEKVQYKFERLGKTTIACRVQDDLGGEKIYTEAISVK